MRLLVSGDSIDSHFVGCSCMMCLGALKMTHLQENDKPNCSYTIIEVSSSHVRFSGRTARTE